MIDYQPLMDSWREDALSQWALELPTQLADGLSQKRYGDLSRWLQVLDSLPELPVASVHLNTDRVGARGDTPLSEAASGLLRDSLLELHPWRKGPFELFGVHIDTEWRSDWKWLRLQGAIESLRGRRVLDVGCGSGYHCWRMLGAGAREVIGIDPTPLFVVQFWAIQKYLQQKGIWVLPLGIERMPKKLRAFDTVFSMGVLYHRRSPMDHLLELRDCLRPGGQLVLETLVIEGDQGNILLPEGRYARMGNVWFLPTAASLLVWLRKTGFIEPKIIDISVTTPQEQRSTDWMRFHSLENFLDPDHPTRTVEGYPAPQRAILTATAPAS